MTVPVTNAAASGLNVATPSDGGFLIQPDVVTSILERVYSIGEVIQRCKPQPLSGNSLKIPAVDETSRADGSRFGGIRAYWTEEAGTISSSAPKFRQIELHLRKVAALVYTTDELQADAPALAGFIASRLPDELMFTIENAIFNGTGAGMPLGIFNSGAIITVSKETSQAATTLLAMNLKKMWARMWASCRKNAAWFYNQDCEPYLWSLYEAVKNVAGTENVGGYVTPVVSVAPDGSIRIFGRPAIPVEYCSTLGTLGDIVLADMSQYILATKSGQGVQAASSMHVRFINDEMAYRFTFRVDGQPEWNTTLTPKNGSNTLSPFVIVETRS
jgi:HK97 family phage major capsid protein